MKFTKAWMGAVIAVSASLTVTVPNSAEAAPSCATSGIGGSEVYNIGALKALGAGGCQIGDKIYSDFDFSMNWTNGVFGFSNSPADQHTFSGASLALMGSATPYTYTYKVAVDPTSPESFLSYRTDIGSSNLTGTSASNTLENSLNPDVSFAQITAGSPSAGNLVAINGTTAVFTGTVSVTSGRIDTITDSLNQTPGPLPILGAGAAFGFSRKLRNRIKASA